MLQTDGAPTLAHGGVKIVARRGRAELFRISLAKPLDGFGGEAGLAHGHEIERAQLPCRTLRLGIEGADRLQRIAEEIEPDRRRGAGRIEIENAAARGVIPNITDGARALVAIGLAPDDDVLHLQRIARRGRERSLLHIRAGRQRWVSALTEATRMRGRSSAPRVFARRASAVMRSADMAAFGETRS